MGNPICEQPERITVKRHAFQEALRAGVPMCFGGDVGVYDHGENVYELEWNKHIKYGDVHHMTEVEGSKFNFDLADTGMLMEQFTAYEGESRRLSREGLVVPAYEFCLKCSHAFNLLDARGAISVTERTGYIARVRKLAKRCAENYYAQREEMGFPLLKGKTDMKVKDE